jgi:glucose/arabinose dehydrogenase
MKNISAIFLCIAVLFSSCQKRSPEEKPTEKKSLEVPTSKVQPQKPITIVTPDTDADNGGLFLPDGFGALVVADSVGPTRHLAVNDNGDIYVKLRIVNGARGNVALRDTDNDGKADIIQRFGNYPNDGSFATEMRIHRGYLYFSSELVVYRQKLSPSKLIPDGVPETILTDRYPIRWHNAKSLAFDKQGFMYVTFSAPTNACENWNTISGDNYAGVKGYYPCPELKDQGGIWKFDPNKLGQFQSDGQRFATGLRSIVAISWNDEDNSLYAVNHGRDYLHSHAPQFISPWENAILPSEEFVKIKEGNDFGWPYTYYDHFKQKRMLAPEYGGDGVKLATGYSDPIMGLPAHWAPNDLLFYKGDQFPERYKKGAFIAFHGSTNRNPYPQAGYIVAFVPFENGKPIDKWEVFADGFAQVETIIDMPDAKYRPMGLSEGPDGSLYISESRDGKIWRIIYNADPTKFTEADLVGMEKRKSKSYLKIPDEKMDILSLR